MYPAADPRETAGAPLLPSILDELGLEVVSGHLPSGHTFTLHDLSRRFDVSRTVAREVMRALEQMGLVMSSRRVGIKVLPESSWDVLDRTVIRWRRAAASQRPRQSRELAELRCAVEPHAADVAALRRTEAQARLLTDLAFTLAKLASRPDAETDRIRSEIREVDTRFHTTVLEASGNHMFAALAPALLAEHDTCLFDGEAALAAHAELAASINGKDPAAARRAAEQLAAFGGSFPD